MKIIPICGVLVWTTITVAIGAPSAQVVLAGFYSEDNVTLVPFAIKALMNRYDPQTYPNIHSGKYIGTDDGVPSYVCSKITVSIGGRDIRIPKKSYSDLEDIMTIDRMVLDVRDKQWSAKIEGGSGAGFYELEFIFDSERLLERRFVMSKPEQLMGPNMPKSAPRNQFNEMIVKTEKY